MKKLNQRSLLRAIYLVSICGIILTLSAAFPGLFFGLINLPGLVLVVGGTLAALLVSHSYGDVKAALARVKWKLRSARLDSNADEQRLLQVANWLRNGRIRQAEQAMEQIDDPLLRHGVQWVLDRTPREELEKYLNWRIHSQCQESVTDARLLRQMASFAPAFGMLGTLMGLIHMLYGLGDQTLGQMGQSMAFAMTTTLYGLVAANLVLKPLAIKLEQRIERDFQQLSILREAVLMLADRQHPVLIHESLAALRAQQFKLPANVGKLQAA